MPRIIHRTGIKAPVEKVYAALATIDGLARWWTKDTTGISEKNKAITFRFHSPEGKEVGCMEMEVLLLEPGKNVQWKCTDGPQEWIGTDLDFTLHREDDYTIVLFSHNNSKEEVEFKAHCSMKWAIFLLSLKEYVETGKGRPSPDDIKIDNWN